MTDNSELNPVELATELTIAWLSNPNTRVSAGEVPAFLQTMHTAVTSFTAAGEPADSQTAQHVPAVSVRKSLASEEHLISLIDGKPYRTLKRHLSRHGLTPDQYRERFNLKPDYPMVSGTYSEARRAMAKTIGLGRKPGTTVKPAGSKPAPRPRGPKA